MMRTQPSRILAVAVAAGGLATPFAVGLATAGAAPAPQTITFQEPRPQLAEDDLPPRSKEKLSLGDRLAIGGALESAGHKHLGTFGGTCTVVGTGTSFTTTPLVCEAVYRVAGGQIVAIGAMMLSRTNLVVVGGSGDYAGAHGTVTPGKVAKGFDDADKVAIAG